MKLIEMLLLLSVLASGLAAEEKPPNWERMKACAAQAEKAAHRVGEELLRNHYSPKYERCFMFTAIRETEFMSVNRLLDAFEGTELAAEIWDFEKESKHLCAITGLGGERHPKPCSEVEAYIEEHLTQ
jgi:hypothetical protein